MSNVITEITPLSESDTFFIVDRKKTALTFPVHQHKEFEINYLLGAEGAHRIVGDRIEVIGNEDLAMIGGENVEHAWEQGDCVNTDIREITIQFPRELFCEALLNRSQFSPIRKLLARAGRGLAFRSEDIDKIRDLLYDIPSTEDKFTQFLKFLYLLYQLGTFSADARVLSSDRYITAEVNSESRRVLKVKQYIRDHFGENLKLKDLAAMVNMTPTSFSRFFRLRACMSLTEYISDVRLGNAARLLVDTTHSISEVCYMCGYNNLSNFNRQFKARRGLSPGQFRAVNKKS